MSPSPYEPPHWSAVPSSSLWLEVIKEGIVIEKKPISDRSFYVLGRDPTTAHVVLPHPSVSRQHAVIQHRDSGEVYIYDLGSTHGSSLNKKPLAAHQYVRLALGSIIRLGTGSRMLCLMGEDNDAVATVGASARQRSDGSRPMPGGSRGTTDPAPAERLKARAERIAKTTGRSSIRAEDLHAQGAGWGFSEDAAAEAVDREEVALEQMSFEKLFAQAKAQGLNMTVRQARLVEQLDRRSEKLSNLASETEKIAAKEVEGLSDGQRAQLTRNEERAEQLRQEISALEDQIAESIREQLGTKRALEGGAAAKEGQRGGRAAAAAAADDDDDDDDEDDFFDRTGGSKKKRGVAAAAASASGAGTKGERVESEATLRAKLQSVAVDIAMSSKRFDALRNEQASRGATGGAAAASVDPLEAYMCGNTLEVGANKMREEQLKLAALDAERQRLERLLAFVAPALRPNVPARAPCAASAPAAAASSPASSAASTGAKPPCASAECAAAAPAAAATATPVHRGGGAAAGGLGAVLVTLRAEGGACATALPTDQRDTAGGPEQSGGQKRKRVEGGEARPAGATGPVEQGAAGPSGEGTSALAAPAAAKRTTVSVGPTRSATERFREDYAAAVQRLRQGAAAPLADVPPAQASAQADSSAAEAAAEDEAARSAGLGFGAAMPDSAKVMQVRQRMLEQQRLASKEATLGEGLNRMGDGTASQSASNAGETSRGAKVRPHGATPAPRPAQKGASTRPDDWRVVGPAESEDLGFEWTPPEGQAGDGKTALNAKFGY